MVYDNTYRLLLFQLNRPRKKYIVNLQQQIMKKNKKICFK